MFKEIRRGQDGQAAAREAAQAAELQPINVDRLSELLAGEDAIIAEMRNWLTLEKNHPGRGDHLHFVEKQQQLDQFLAEKGFAVPDAERKNVYTNVLFLLGDTAAAAENGPDEAAQAA